MQERSAQERLLLHKIDGQNTGLLDYEPPTPGPHYQPTPGFWWNGRCWVDDDGQHVWFAHDCTEGRVSAMLPWPTWQVLIGTGEVSPSISCGACGLHSHYRIEWTPYGRDVVPTRGSCVSSHHTTPVPASPGTDRCDQCWHDAYTEQAMQQ